MLIDQRKFRKVMRAMPAGVGHIMLRHVQRNFANAAYRGTSWQPRQNPNNRKPLLVDSGKLKSSFKVREANWQIIRVGSDRQVAGGHNLAQIHNEGVNANATVRTYTRRGRNGSVRVSSHRRQMHTPQRKMMPIPGKDPIPPELWAEIEQFVGSGLDSIFK